jgi:hypothetical protein
MIGGFMEYFLSFAMSSLGVGIAWVCTVFSTFFAVYASIKSKRLAAELISFRQTLDQSKTVDQSSDTVVQSGAGSVYTKHNSGGMKINL